MEGKGSQTRESEWYVPKFGPRRFRLFVGLTFYPYTLMNASYVAIGSLLSPTPDLGRMEGMMVVYILAVGIAAHSLDAMAPNRPWGEFLSRRQLEVLALAGLIPALAVGLWYAVVFAPLLLPIGIVELFFLLAYNLELLDGRLHGDLWFALSWGLLPVLAGFAVQTNSLSLVSVIGGLFGFCTAYVEISASRPYKELKRGSVSSSISLKFEAVLKGVVATVLIAAAMLLVLRLT